MLLKPNHTAEGEREERVQLLQSHAVLGSLLPGILVPVEGLSLPFLAYYRWSKSRKITSAFGVTYGVRLAPVGGMS